MIKALLIEDHPSLLDVVSRQLKRLGFAAITVSNGVDGVEKASGEKPDLILMDIIMPGMDGREATRRIRINPETKDIPILAITSLFRESEIRQKSNGKFELVGVSAGRYPDLACCLPS